MAKRLRAGILGYGRMGRAFVAAMQQKRTLGSLRGVRHQPAARQLAASNIPSATILRSSRSYFCSIPSIDVVGLFTLADARPQQIRQRCRHRKHVLAEKPIAADVATEWQLVREIEASDRFVAVNLFQPKCVVSQRYPTLHQREGQIGDLAIIRICHMTPGHMPRKATIRKVPRFMTAACIMSTSPAGTPTANTRPGMRKVFACGTTRIPGGCRYTGRFPTELSSTSPRASSTGTWPKQQPHNCYVDVIGTKGVARMRHDFSNGHG